jgi:hypothetical protein
MIRRSDRLAKFSGSNGDDFQSSYLVTESARKVIGRQVISRTKRWKASRAKKHQDFTRLASIIDKVRTEAFAPFFWLLISILRYSAKS